MIAKIAMALAATTMVAAPLAANPASKLSVAKSVRGSTTSEGSNKALGAGAFGALLGVGVVAILVVGLVVGDSDDDSDSN